MAQLTDAEDLSAVWRALTGDSIHDGWRTISVGGSIQCQIRAGRHFPGNEEAILVGLNLPVPPHPSTLPAGTGFAVKSVQLGQSPSGILWFGLVRQPAGRIEFFAMMAADVISTVLAAGIVDDDKLLSIFLGRVRAWQRFMEKDSEGVISPEAEIGLHGELQVLYDILKTGISPASAIDAWRGPFDGLQDFVFPSGAIEVKATVSTGTFPAVISSLEQLDETTLPSLHLAGVRLRKHLTGLNLSQRADIVRGLLANDPTAVARFENGLLHAGFYPAFSDRYPRTLIHDTTYFWEVTGNFPRLTHEKIPSAVRRCRYEIDLELVAAPKVSLLDVLTATGAY